MYKRCNGQKRSRQQHNKQAFPNLSIEKFLGEHYLHIWKTKPSNPSWSNKIIKLELTLQNCNGKDFKDTPFGPWGLRTYSNDFWPKETQIANLRFLIISLHFYEIK